MKYSITILFAFLFLSAYSQLNVELLSLVEFGGEGNDVWGYVAPNGDEYGIMGTEFGVAVVNITDPRNPNLVDFIKQRSTFWRDIKTWGQYAYVTSENSDNGVLVIDLTNLPDSISSENVFLEVPSGETIGACHNIFIDEFGFAYLSGCDVNNGGVEIFDVFTNPGQLTYVGAVNLAYSHDAYVRDNKLYNSEINRGHFAIYDVKDKANIELISTQETPFKYTHNAWLSDDGNVLFTTDELGNAPVAAYDVSDPLDIRYLDEFRPKTTVNTGVIPHNVHVWNNWLIISYYSDGCIIVDASRPDNLIEVGNFDTFFGTTVGFNGAWGAYPFFPSGTIIIGDIEDGMYVLGPTYKRASHLEGTVTDIETGEALNAAQLLVPEIGLEEYTTLGGIYKTGTIEEGSFEMTVTFPGYVSETRTIELKNGVLALEDFKLKRREPIMFQGKVIDAVTREAIVDADVALVDENGNQLILTSNVDGNIALSQLLTGKYDIISAKWGYKYNIQKDVIFSTTNLTPNIQIELYRGYEDIFSLDLGWESVLEGEKGNWFRAKPIGIELPQAPLYIAPPTDSDKDFGGRAYVTGQSTDLNAGSLLGKATLRSPSFDPREIPNATITFDYWLWAISQQFTRSGQKMYISLDNGIDKVQVGEILMDELEIPQTWLSGMQIRLEDYITLTASMRLIIELENQEIFDLVEGGFDNFKLTEGAGVSVSDVKEELGFVVFPNPSTDMFTVKIPETYLDGTSYLILQSLNGKSLGKKRIKANQTELNLGQYLDAGVYFLQLTNKQQRSQNIKIVKL